MSDQSAPSDGTIEKPWGTLTPDGPIIKDRQGFVLDEDFGLHPQSLTGSWFHVVFDEEIIWQGVVVAEPQASRYLVQIDKLEEGAEQVQRLFTLDTMMGLGDEARRLLEGAMSEASAPVVEPRLEWRFFDSRDKANAAFVAWATKTRRTERT
jgi:hypothetical protein